MAAARAGVGPPIRAAASRHSRGDAPQHARRVCHRQQHVWGADGTDDEPRSMAQSPGLRPIRPRRHRRISALDGMGTGDAAGPAPTACGPQPRPPRSPKRPSRTRSRTRAERPARVERAGQAQPATRQAYQGPAMTQAAFFPPPNPGSPPSRSCGDYLGVWRRRIEVLSNQEVLSGLTWPEMPGSRSSLHYDHSLIPTFSLQRRTSHSPDQNSFA